MMYGGKSCGKGSKGGDALGQAGKAGKSGQTQVLVAGAETHQRAIQAEVMAGAATTAGAATPHTRLVGGNTVMGPNAAANRRKRQRAQDNPREQGRMNRWERRLAKRLIKQGVAQPQIVQALGSHLFAWRRLR